jgi:hypothetical protein
MEKSGKKTNEQANLAHSTCIFWPGMGWELSSIIYSLLFLFCILFIVSTQIAASRQKNLTRGSGEPVSLT